MRIPASVVPPPCCWPLLVLFLLAVGGGRREESAVVVGVVAWSPSTAQGRRPRVSSPVFRPSHSSVGIQAPASEPLLRLFSSPRNGGEGGQGASPPSGEEAESEAERLRKRAAELREQIRRLEEQRGGNSDADGGPRRRTNNNDEYLPVPSRDKDDGRIRSPLHRTRVLVVGANGRLGSMVCRHLLRNFPTTEVVAAVHVVGENSPTARGYGRLSYEVGAEDGIGQLGAAWSEERTATFQYDPVAMGGYNLQNLRVVECELLDPIQCQTVAKGCDAVVWCATDFNGNQPRAISSLNVALLFRAVSRPDKGRVEVEGLQNMLGALKLAKQEANRSIAGTPDNGTRGPVDFVLVSAAPEALDDFETPFGSFRDIKRQGERMALRDFPSLTSTVLQLARFEDNFVGEGLELQTEIARAPSGGADDAEDDGAATASQRARRKINRRDAARAAVDALVNPGWDGKTVQVWTAS